MALVRLHLLARTSRLLLLPPVAVQSCIKRMAFDEDGSSPTSRSSQRALPDGRTLDAGDADDYTLNFSGPSRDQLQETMRYAQGSLRPPCVGVCAGRPAPRGLAGLGRQSAGACPSTPKVHGPGYPSLMNLQALVPTTLTLTLTLMLVP
ncbi:hypothetical protein P280DRAFT_516997 [Massarina eburnea CBS 473.64]|uniref:Uncharacterized protein n=1 Tax=Massarina eburnea CBS 473.64 TaxID=1395130 RepID=A0A6A6S6D6_9PLEO|nr:hypothetical protein P280DRAFT_516997 [Massarina eburnea CBS 473.64]